MRRVLISLFIAAISFGCGDDDVTPGADGSVDVMTSDTSAAVDASADDDAGPDDAGGDAGSEPDAGPEDVGVDAPMLGSAGCTSGEGLSEGEHTFTIDGNERDYIVRLPNGYSTERSWPIIFALHGNGGNTSYWDGESGDRDIRGAFEDEAILIIAHAIDNQWRNYDEARQLGAEHRLRAQLLRRHRRRGHQRALHRRREHLLHGLQWRRFVFPACSAVGETTFAPSPSEAA